MLAGVHRSFPPTSGGRMTRRAVLGSAAALGAALVAACTSSPEPAPTTGTSSPEPDADADAPVRTSVAQDEAAIIALYDAVIAAYPGLSGDLVPLRDEHMAHAEAMGTSTPSAAASAAPASQPQALAALIDAEQQAIAQRTAACEASTSTDLARTVALIAASEAGHAEFLRGLT